jgi:hypothetical protein
MLSVQGDSMPPGGPGILDSVDLHAAAAAAAVAASGGLPPNGMSDLGEPPRKLAVLGLPWETT